MIASQLTNATVAELRFDSQNDEVLAGSIVVIHPVYHKVDPGIKSLTGECLFQERKVIETT